MASKRRNPIRAILSRTRAKSKRVARTDKLALISKYQRVSDPTNSRAVDKLYAKYKRYPASIHKTISDKKTRENLKARGFFTTDKGAFIDSPRDVRRKKIPRTRFEVNQDGTVVFRNHKRRDYIIGFTKAERIAFAKDPEGFQKKKIAELERKYPALRGRKVVRLQWGAYQATKDFVPTHFLTRYGANWNTPVGKKMKDILTGFHIVVHYNPKGKKKNARRSR